MKKILILILVISLCVLCACNKNVAEKSDIVHSQGGTKLPSTETTAPGESETTVPDDSVQADIFDDDFFESPIDVADPEEYEQTPSEPVVTEPTVTEPDSSEPVASEPVATTPDASEPQETIPAETTPTPSEPNVTEPDVSEPQPTTPGNQNGNSGSSKPIELPFIPG